MRGRRGRTASAAALCVLTIVAGCSPHGAKPPAASAAGASGPAPNPAAAADTLSTPPARNSELAALREYLGKYPYEGVNYLTVDPLARRLKALLGEKYPIFIESMNVIGPLREDQGVFYTAGNAPHRGMLDVGAIVIDPEQDALYVWLMEDRKVGEFREDQKTVRVPPELRAFLDSVLAAEE